MLNSVGSILDGLGNSRIDEARRKRSTIPIEFVVSTKEGDDIRSSFQAEIGAPYSVKYTKGYGTVIRDEIFNLTVIGSDVVEDEEYKKMEETLDNLESFIQKGNSLVKGLGADFRYHGRPDSITGKVSSEGYGFTINLNDNSMYKEVKNVLRKHKIL